MKTQINEDKSTPSSGEITGRTVARGALWSVGGQIASLLVQILTISLLGRLLKPEDFGTVAMVTAIIGVGELFRDFGLSAAAVQAPTLSHEEQSNLFWLNSIMGGLIGLVFFALAGLIANFYGQPDLGVITQVLSITFLINGITTQPEANLIRGLRLDAIAISGTASSVCSLITGLAMALLGYGFWSIVGMQISRAASRMLFSFAYSKFTPSLPKKQVSVRSFLRFGTGLFGAQILNYVSKNFDTVMIGKTLGAISLGFYSRAYQLAFMPVAQLSAPLSRVAVPTLSRLNDDEKKYNEFLYRAQSILILSAAAGYTIALVYADMIIRIALGPGWQDSTPIFRVLCMAGIFEAAHQVTYWLFVSKANTIRHFQFAMLTRPVLIVAIFLIVPYGGTAVAFVFLGWIAVAWPIGLYWASKGTQISPMEVLHRAIRIILSAGLVGFGAIVVRTYLGDQGELIELTLSAITAVVISIGIYILSSTIRGDVNAAMSAVKLARAVR